MSFQANSNTNEIKSKWRHLSEEERYKIEGLLQAKLTNRAIAKILGKSHGSINEEVRRGQVTQLTSELVEVRVYKADYAQDKADIAKSNKGTGLKIGNDHALVKFLEMKIRDEKFSPDAALASARKLGTFTNVISTRTLYTYISNGLFLGLSNRDLLVKSDKKKREYRKIRKVALNNRKGTSISERPESIEHRLEKGHWEIDLVVGKQGTKPVILTLVERKSRKSLYVYTNNKTQQEVITALKKLQARVGGDFEQVFKTITADNGSEFLDFEGMKEASGCDEVYYAHPYSSWERGSNENGNRILRRFIPKGTDLTQITEIQLQRFEDWVNNYPRRILKYLTANEAYEAA